MMENTLTPLLQERGKMQKNKGKGKSKQPAGNPRYGRLSSGRLSSYTPKGNSPTNSVWSGLSSSRRMRSIEKTRPDQPEPNSLGSRA